MAFARLLASKSHLVPGKLKISELLFEVPENYSSPSSGTIQVFARSVTRHEKPLVDPENEKKTESHKPWFVFLHGGPGMPCEPPQHGKNIEMTNAVLNKGYRMLYIDQRGTGLSTPISAAALALKGDAHKQADYLKLFRADSIVRDCEAFRENLTEDCLSELKKWSIMGQSFGGFCVLTYLSKYPQGLREAFTTGGLAPINSSPDQICSALHLHIPANMTIAPFGKVMERNKAYYAKYPEDVAGVHSIALHIKSKCGLRLPSGATLTVRVFLTLGLNFGVHGGFDTVHDLVLRMQSDLNQFQLITHPTLKALEAALNLDHLPLYVILHESIYCQGVSSNWAAERIGKTFREFQWLSGSPQNPSSLRDHPLYFSGEMIYPFMLENFPELGKMREVADILARYEGWPQLYDVWQLAKNEVPLYSLSYVDDMFVDFGLAQETAKAVGNCKHGIVNGMHHNALEVKGEEVMRWLFELRDDSID